MNELNQTLVTLGLSCVVGWIVLGTLWSLVYLAKDAYRHLTNTRSKQLLSALERNADLQGKLVAIATWSHHEWTNAQFRKMVQDLLKDYK